jgi:Caspase domain
LAQQLVSYVGQNGQLSGCHNDCLNMCEYLKNVHGFSSNDMVILMDDAENKYERPTRENILKEFANLAKQSKSGDAVFVHYSGHGAKIRDDGSDEKDGYDETLVPVDYDQAGQIRDDDIFQTLVGPMAAGVTLTCCLDCCHSGSCLDLPYVFVADGTQEEMFMSDDFDFAALLKMFQTFTQSPQGRKIAQSLMAVVMAGGGAATGGGTNTTSGKNNADCNNLLQEIDPATVNAVLKSCGGRCVIL